MTYKGMLTTEQLEKYRPLERGTGVSARADSLPFFDQYIPVGLALNLSVTFVTIEINTVRGNENWLTPVRCS